MPKGLPWSRAEVFAVSVLFLCFLFLRLINLGGVFANVDEVSAMNQLGIPLISGGSASTSFLSSTVLLQIFYPLLSFPGVRLITVFFAASAMLVFYNELRHHAKTTQRLLTLAMFTFAWYYAYISRLFEVGGFVAPMGLLTLTFLLRYLRTKRVRDLYLAFIAFGIGLEFNATPFLYGGVLLGAFALLEAAKGRLQLRHLAALAVLTLVIGAPYIWITLFKDPISKAPLWTYGFFGESQDRPIYAINLRHPLMAAKSVAYFYFSSFTEKSPLLFSLLGLGLLSLPLLLWLRRSTRLLLVGYSLLLALYAISPAPIYHQGQMHILWLLWIVLVPFLFTMTNWLGKASLTLIILGLLAFQIPWYASLAQNQVVDATTLFGKYRLQQSQVYISDGAMLKLKYYPGLFNTAWPVFYCSQKDAAKFFSDKKPPFLVLLTQDCPQDQICPNCTIRQLAGFDQVREPYLKHGILLLGVK